MASKFKNKNFKESLIRAFNGLWIGFKRERNLKIYFIGALVSIPLNLYLHFSLLEHVVYAMCAIGVISSEYLNTAIEILCDHVQPEYEESIKKAKDVAAAGVVCWGLLFSVAELAMVIRHFV